MTAPRMLAGIGMTSQRTRDRMAARLRGQGITDPRVLEAMAAVPRHVFVEEALASRAYEDTALPIGFGQTISQPYVVARMIEELARDRELGRVLEVGTGCGYQAAVLAQLALEVYSVERIRELTDGNGADVCIEAVGRPEVLEQAFYARDLAGTVVLVGVPTPDMRLDMPLVDFFSRGGALRSSWYGDCLPERDFPTLIDLYLQGRLPLDQFVSERIGFDGVEEAFHKMHGGKVLRSVVIA